MSNTLDIKFQSDDAGMIALLQRLVSEQGKIAEGVDKVNGLYKQQASEARALERAARRIYEDTRTPMEQYKTRLQQLDALHKAGKIDVETHRRSAVAAANELAKATGTLTAKEREAAAQAQQKAEAERRAADLARQAKEEERRLGEEARRITQAAMTPLERYNQRLAELKRHLDSGRISQETYNRSVRQARTDLEAAGASGQKAFGSAALGQVAAMAAGYLSVSAAVGTITRALNEMEATRKEAAQKAIESRRGLGSLLMLTTDEKEYADLVAKAREVYAAGGARTVDEAARLVFSVASSDQMQHLKLFTELSAAGILENPEAMASAAGSLIESMGEGETGDLRQILSKTLAASKPAPGRTEEVLTASSKGAPSAKVLGLTDEELLAASGVVAKAIGRTEDAGTAVAAMFKAFERHQDELQGMNLAEMLAAISQKGLKGLDLQRYFGRQEGQKAYRLLLEAMPLYEETLADTRESGKGDRIGKILGFINVDQSLRAARIAEQAKAREELSRDELGSAYNLSEAVLLDEAKTMRKRGSWELSILHEDWNARFRRRFFGTEEYLRSEMSSGRLYEYGSPETRRGVRAYYREHYPEDFRDMESRGFSHATPAYAEENRALDQAAEKLQRSAEVLRETAALQKETADRRRDPATNHRDGD